MTARPGWRARCLRRKPGFRRPLRAPAPRLVGRRRSVRRYRAAPRPGPTFRPRRLVHRRESSQPAAARTASASWSRRRRHRSIVSQHGAASKYLGRLILLLSSSLAFLTSTAGSHVPRRSPASIAPPTFPTIHIYPLFCLLTSTGYWRDPMILLRHDRDSSVLRRRSDILATPRHSRPWSRVHA